jgi:hypothetical protein
MRLRTFHLAALVLVLPLFALNARADSIDIGTAGPFAVLGEAGVTNTGSSTIYGSVAGSTGTPSVTGFPTPGSVVLPGVLYTTGVANSGPGTPFGDADAAYGYAAGLSVTDAEGTASLGAGGVGGTSVTALTPGVYSFTSTTVLLNGTLYLNAEGNDNASWIFLIPALLTTGSSSDVIIEDAGALGTTFTGAITWDVGAGATLGPNTTFLGTIISDTGTIALDAAATIGCGRAVSLGGQVTLIDNVISTPANCLVTTTGISTSSTGAPIAGAAIATPEPGTFALLLCGLLPIGGLLTLRKLRGSSAAGGSGVLAGTIDGCVFADTANTLAGQTIVGGCSSTSSISGVPEPGSAGLASLGGLLGLLAWRKFRVNA